ncbi:luciferin 4-monooxygenase [Aedes aegypti]|uniref:AMP dependent ligase n=1 Tax=Aedes aegypti TaxID=7159 RepID=A0A6I8U2E4_AEDAE|nr:luciferin 4-monooxygenase [Aedes aegypti]
MSRYDPVERIWYGPIQPPLFNPQISIGQIMFSMLERTPERVTQIDGDTGREMTCEEFRLRAIRIVQNLQANYGLKKGEMVVVACRNCENVFPLVLALLAIGAQFVLMPIYFVLNEVKHSVRKYQPKYVFCDDANYGDLSKACKDDVIEDPTIFVLESGRDGVLKFETLLEETGKEHIFSAPYLGDARSTVAVILSTSGTTSMPKGVRLSHAQVVTWSNAYLKVNRGIVFNFSPLSWGTGFGNLYHSITNGTPRLFTRSAFDEDKFFDLLAKYPIRSVALQPSYSKSILCHARCASADFFSIQTWIVFGSISSDALRDKIETMIPNGRTLNVYGLSECGIILHDATGRKPGASGQVAQQVQVRIVDERGHPLGVGEHGELQVKKGEPFLGYFDEPEAMIGLITDEGWLRTGDCGYFDEMHYFHMSERKKDLLCYRNQLIIPGSVECVIEGIEGVMYACVVGVPEEGWEASDLLTAVVVKHKHCQLTEEQVMMMTNERVPDYKQLRGGVIFRDGLPLGGTGKVLRDKVRDYVYQIKGIKTGF